VTGVRDVWSIGQLWRYPAKSMLGERLKEAATVEQSGVVRVGDRVVVRG